MTGPSQASLEHVNLTVPDARATAEMLCRIFHWRIRWQGPAIANGFSIHVGDDDRYVALYTPGGGPEAASIDKRRTGNLNHFGVTVTDLDATEAKIKAEGLQPYNHDDYEPGRRFYFKDRDGVEIEVVSYAH